MNEESRQMEESASRISYLISGYLRQGLSASEHDELDRWVEASDDNMKLFEILTDENYLRKGLEQMASFDTEARLKLIKKKIDFTPEKRRSKISGLLPYGIAAMFIGVSIAVYLFVQRPPVPPNAVAEILPAGNHTTLTLSDGRVIDLNATGNGKIPAEGGSILEKQDGLVAYQPGNNSNETIFHTLSTSTGGQFSLVLPDGSRVWLNAQSSLRFPSNFPADERRVELNGEGYFEVARDASRPFTVAMQDNSKVKVLGTHFNVRDYPDLAAGLVSLLEGSVEVTNGNRRQTLRPGEQLKTNPDAFVVQTIGDVDEVIGWKNRQFVFRDARVSDIMDEIARWYDIDIVYRTQVPDLFTARISRQEPLSRLLQLLELTGKVRFTTENKTVYVYR